jgi:hypothetical protein
VRYSTKVDGVDTPINLTGFTARMQVRSSVKATTPLLSISTTTGEISIDGPTGTITINVPAATTKDLPPTDLKGLNANYPVYDFELVNGSEVTRLFEGNFEIVPEVTR